MGFQSSYLGVAQRLGQLASATVSIMGCLDDARGLNEANHKK